MCITSISLGLHGNFSCFDLHYCHLVGLVATGLHFSLLFFFFQFLFLLLLKKKCKKKADKHSVIWIPDGIILYFSGAILNCTENSCIKGERLVHRVSGQLQHTGWNTLCCPAGHYTIDTHTIPEIPVERNYSTCETFASLVKARGDQVIKTCTHTHTVWELWGLHIDIMHSLALYVRVKGSKQKTKHFTNVSVRIAKQHMRKIQVLNLSFSSAN